MKRTMWTLAAAAIVVLASYGVASACGEHDKKAEAVVAQAANVKEGGKDLVAAKGDCDMADCEKAGCAHAAAANAGGVVAEGAAPCGKAAMVANSNGAVPAVAVEAAAAAPCAAKAGCARKAKAADVAKAEEAKEPVKVAENAK